MDKKALLAQDGWDPNIEQQTFGDQHPYASATPPGPGPSFGPTHSAPYIPQPFPYIPEDAPPMYSSTNPVKSASAPPARNPQVIPPPPTPQEQHGMYYPHGYQPVPQQEAPYAAPLHQHSDPHQSAPPANYGATSNAPYSASSPVAPRRRRVKKPKTSSCCYKCCCVLFLVIIVTSWYLKDFTYLIDGSCNLPDNAESDTITMHFPADRTLDFHYAIRDGIVGNVVVREATNWDVNPDVVAVYRTWRASSPQLSDAMGDFVSLDEAESKVVAGLRLAFNSTEEKKEALRYNCVKADVEIVYPLSRPGTGRLKVEVTNGDIHVKFDKVLKDPPPTFDTLILATTNGEIQIQNAQVITNTTISSANGQIYGSMRTAGAVEAGVLNGPIDLSIDTSTIPGQKEWSPRKLDVKLDTLNGPVTLEVLPSFQGHFKIEAVVGRAGITASDSIQYKKNTSNQVIGWVSVDGKEPLSKLPRILLSSLNGNVKAKIGTSSRD